MKKKVKLSDRIFNVTAYTVAILLILVCTYPFYYIFIYSLSDAELAASGVTFLPKGFTLSNYAKVLQLEGLLPAAGMSVLRTVVGALITMLCCAFLGYLFTKNMYGRKFFYRLMMVTTYISGGLIPTFLIFKSYGLLNTFWVYVLPSAVIPYYVLLNKTFIESIPVSLEESAKLDGAGNFAVFSKIIVPLSKPIMASTFVFEAVNQWNSWIDNKIYNTNGKFDTLQLLLQTYLNETARLQALLEQLGDTTMIEQAKITPMSIRMTVTFVVVFPILCVYPYMQRFFVKGLMVGAVKG